MRIAVNALSVQSGGGLTFLKNLLKSLLLLDQKNEYVVLTTEAKASALGLSNSSQSNLRTIICPARGWAARACWEQVMLPMVLHREKVDVLYAPGNQGPVLCPCPLVVLIQNVDPLVREWNGIPPVVRAKREALRILMKASVSRARKVIAISEYTRKLLTDEFKCSYQEIVVVPHGSPLDAGAVSSYGSRGQAGSCKVERPYLLVVSNIKYNKNYETLIDAFSIVHSKTSEPLNLVIAGEIEQRQYFLRLKHLVQRNGISSRVKFLGGVNQETLRVLYVESAGLVFPSRVESFGLPLLEAMAYGVPVAASRIEPIVEVCGDAALYFDPENNEEMAEAMVQIMKNAGLRETLIERGLVRAKLFSWEQTARRTLELLRAVAELG